MSVPAEQVIIPAGDIPSAPAPNAPAPAPTTPPAPSPAPAAESSEIAYLKAHGFEAGELQAQLESIMTGRQTSPDGTPPSSAPAAPPAPVPAPTQDTTPAPAPQTPQEKALDPYAPNGADDGDVDEGVVIDGDGRARDARTGKYVPIKALHHERGKVKNLHEENTKLREMQARAEERLAVLNEFLEKSNAPEPVTTEQQPPAMEDLTDPDVDIFKFAKQMKERFEQQNAYVKKLEERLEGNTKQSQQQIEELAAAQMLVRDVQSFSAKHPDLPKAYDHMRTMRDRQLQALGYADAEQRADFISREEKVLQMQALKNKKSYGQVVYDLAQTYGYQVPAAPAPTPPPPAPVAAPPAPSPAPATTQAPGVDPAAAAKVEAIRNGQTLAAPSLSGQGGASSEGLTVSRLANMTETEFLELAAKMGGKSRLDSYFRGI